MSACVSVTRSVPELELKASAGARGDRYAVVVHADVLTNEPANVSFDVRIITDRVRGIAHAVFASDLRQVLVLAKRRRQIAAGDFLITLVTLDCRLCGARHDRKASEYERTGECEDAGCRHCAAFGPFSFWRRGDD